jgi:hypothetical protein
LTEDAIARNNRTASFLDYFLRIAMASIQPTQVPNMKRPKRGFNQSSERLNGRAAMVGFAALVVLELLTGKGLLTLLGLS